MGKLDVRIRHGGGGPDLAALLPVAAVVVIGALVYEALSAFARMLGDIAAVAVVAAVSAAVAVGGTLLVVRLRSVQAANEARHAPAIAAAFQRERQAQVLVAPAPLALPAPQQVPQIHIHIGEAVAAALGHQPPLVVIPPSGEQEVPR